MSGLALTLSAIFVITSTGVTLWSVKARLPRRRLLTAKAPAFVRSSLAFATATAAFVLAALSDCAAASVPVIGPAGFTVAEKAVAATRATSLVVAASEFSLAAARVEAVGAVVVAVAETGLELASFFSTGLLVAVGAFGTFGASSDFLASAFSSFLDSAFASLFSVAAGVSATSVFSVAGAGVSEVAAELDRSTFGTGAPTP